MTETQERFLRTVLTRVPLDSVVEMHLFPPIRRGTLETGVAVIATLLPPAPLTVVDGATDEAAEPSSADVVLDTEPAGDVADVAAAEMAEEGDTETDVMIEASVIGEADVDTDVADEPVHDVEGEASAPAGELDEPLADAMLDADAPAIASDEDRSPYADESMAASTEAEVIEAGQDEPEFTAAPVSPRMRIMTASYRHTIKGVDRGKWSVEVQEEADAPLDAVEAVLRGVRHRSTEPADPEQVSHEALAALVAPIAVAPAA